MSSRSQPVWLWWSTGKDSAWTLQTLHEKKEFDVTGLVTTVNRDVDRVSMHAVRSELLKRQADSVGLPVKVVEIPHPCSNEKYEAAVSRLIGDAREAGVELMAFGDLYLDDVRRYRERLFAGTQLTPLFPLWGQDTGKLARSMVDAGLRAIVTCVDPKTMPGAMAGREFDAKFLDDLPPDVDPCGERGEFHTFAYRGPMFDQPLSVSIGEIVEREGFVFADVLPAGPHSEKR